MRQHYQKVAWRGDIQVALKIAKGMDSYRKAARSEARILAHINLCDSEDRQSCVRMLNWFHFHGHVCIVFELLGLSTYDFLQENNFYPYPLEQIRHMGWQIFRAVDFLHQSKLIHTDLKPENILFINSEYSVEYNAKMKRYEKKIKNPDVKIADFGNAVYHDEDHSSEIQTRHYRAPEVILGLKWDQSCDVWSLGCILLEYYLGYVVFMTHDSKEHLAMMERILGPIPLSLFLQTKRQRYVTGDHLDSCEYTATRAQIRKRCKSLKNYRTTEDSDHIALFDLIQKTLEYIPERRISPSEVLKHLFFHPLQQT
ncbi:dual specificity protein kinase CLK1-like isoform X2 [Polypterus senegalus]|uniref:dual specificity protein kinase CLK1-like isoform X2 n=1 Tax=Polypterus senegalus TaxID=55291 RepID=UPI0019662426|nr:dual specificity protein kinase CLK1-like isoform X2 [Polypterus senegalus]